MTPQPDLDEIEPLESDEATFQRDEDGALLPYWKAIEVGDGDYRKIQIEPTPIGEMNRLQEKYGDRDELDLEEISNLMSDKIVQPDIDWEEDVHPKYYIAAMQALFEEMFGENQVGLANEVRRELEKRQAETGNSAV